MLYFSGVFHAVFSLIFVSCCFYFIPSCLGRGLETVERWGINLKKANEQINNAGRDGLPNLTQQSSSYVLKYVLNLPLENK